MEPLHAVPTKEIRMTLPHDVDFQISQDAATARVNAARAIYHRSNDDAAAQAAMRAADEAYERDMEAARQRHAAAIAQIDAARLDAVFHNWQIATGGTRAQFDEAL